MERQERLSRLLANAAPCLRFSAALEGRPEALVKFCREHRLEGILAKKRDCVYRPGDRCASWMKFKTRQEAEFIVGGFLPSLDRFSSIAVGFKQGRELRYAGKFEAYLPKSAKLDVINKLVSLACTETPFVKVPRKKQGDTWSPGITEEDLGRFVWLKPKLKATVQFQEWTRAGYLRHASLRDFQS